MTKKFAAALTLSTALAGCVPPPVTWIKPGATTQSFAQDKLICIQVATSTVGGFEAIGTPMMLAIAADANNQQKRQVFDTCMEAKGWTPQQQARR